MEVATNIVYYYAVSIPGRVYVNVMKANAEAWYSRPRSTTGFSSESREESEKVQIWALDIPRMIGVSGLPVTMPADTRRRLRGKVSAEHEDLESRLH